MKRLRTAILCLLTVLNSPFLQTECHAGDADRRTPMNFVIMIADDLGSDDLGCYGHPTIRSPHIDQLAETGLTFDNAFLTTSSCSPSRCSIMTGRYPHNTGAGELHLPLPANQTTFADILKENGYYTAAAGKWHLGPAPRPHFNRIYSRGGPSGCGEWVDSIKDRDKDRPFFLWLAASDPHRGYQPGAVDNPHAPESVVVPPFFPDTPEVRKDLALYYDEVSRFDEFVGAVFDELKNQNLLDSTMIIVLSDNGRPFPRCKTTLYDSGIKTPFIVYASHLHESTKGSRTGSMVSSIDIAPTLLDLAGLAIPESMQGVSFAPVLKNPGTEVRQSIHAEHNWHDFMARERCVRTRRFLYIKNDLPHLPLTPPADAVNSPSWASMNDELRLGRLNPFQSVCFTSPRPEEELYDVVLDPHQLYNLASLPAYIQILQDLRHQHQTWSSDTNDILPDIQEISPDGFDRATGDKLIPKAHPSFQ